ncbi:sialomucin core protein 24-like [Macrotis lagotis]|uniref:sialomucin core protein 24-like n=1 Tax=Macrotis lagotis TaxID=92651 RepID=UPI003D685176
MNRIQKTCWLLLLATDGFLDALCMLSTAQTPKPTANLRDSSSVLPTLMSILAATTNSTPQPTIKYTMTLALAPQSCEVHTSCVESKNVTCFWTVCNGAGYCLENAAIPNCAVVNNSSNCLVETTISPSPTNSTAKTSPSVSTIPAVTTVVTKGTPNTTVIPTSSTRKYSFDASSFIERIVSIKTL